MDEKNFLTKALTETVLTRRSFLKWSAALGGVTVLAGGIKYGMKVVEAAPKAQETEVMTTTCYHNCGGRCILYAEVKDGTVTRILPDQDMEDSFEHPRVIPCLRGRSQRRRVYAPERLKYPMKRVGKRGEGKFERISWEEALDTIASEFTRIKEKYGNESIYFNYASGGNHRLDGTYAGTGPLGRLVRMLGGHVNFYYDYSTACYTAALPLITAGASNSVDDCVNSKLVVLFSDNPIVTRSGGNGEGYYHLMAKKAGAKYIVVDPMMTDTVVALDAEWIPIYPGTDVALIAALAYVMVQDGTYDKEFMAKYAVGFDEDTLPEDAPPNSSWMAYIMGQADGVAKTPEWASKITGIPVDRIVKLAREIASVKPCAMFQGWGWQRRAYGEQVVRALPILCAMTGNFGVSGGSAGLRPSTGTALKMNSFPAGENPIKASISCYMWPDFIERGSEMTNGPQDRIKGAEKLTQNMKFMFNWAGNCLVNQHSDTNGTAKLLEDETKLEFLLVSDNMMTPSAKFADILLPDATQFEIEDIMTGRGEGHQSFALFSHKLVEPMYECKDTLWVAEQLAERLGVLEAFQEGHTSREAWLRDMVASARENHPDFPEYDEFKKKGVFKLIGEGNYVAFKAFVEDPVANPLKTETGKIEIFSPFLQKLNDPEEIPAIPKYIPEWEGVSDPLREKYPLLLLGGHYVPRSHSTFDNVDWLQEAHPQSLWMNTLDAQERGISSGDKVKVFNDRGTVVVPARVTHRIRPGVINLPQGAWFTPDADGVDQRGCINVLTKYHPTPLAKGNPQHTNLAQVEKA